MLKKHLTQKRKRGGTAITQNRLSCVIWGLGELMTCHFTGGSVTLLIWRKNKVDFIFIKSGSFKMGSPENEKGRGIGEDLHEVVIQNSFFVQEATVTVGQWRRFIISTNYQTEAEKEGWSWCQAGRSGWKLQWILPRYNWIKLEGGYWDSPGFFQKEDHPVTCVSWNDVQEYICWKKDSDSRNYRLPSEEEWEYACRAGTETSYSFGEQYSFSKLNGGDQLRLFFKRYRNIPLFQDVEITAPSKSFSPNRWGMYNMHGNVWEWCSNPRRLDAIGSTQTVVNKAKPDSDDDLGRVLKGGSWAYPQRFCRSANKRVLAPDYRASGIGFRLAYSS